MTNALPLGKQVASVTISTSHVKSVSLLEPQVAQNTKKSGEPMFTKMARVLEKIFINFRIHRSQKMEATLAIKSDPFILSKRKTKSTERLSVRPFSSSITNR